MKIVASDNFDRDYVSEWVHTENISEEEGIQKVAILNAEQGDYGNWYFELKPDDYVLRVWEP